MTYNPNRIQFKALPRKDQDRIAGAIARGEVVEFWWTDEWVPNCMGIKNFRAYRIQPTAKPAKDPNRPRPAHKLNLRDGDVVQLVKWEDGSISLIGCLRICGRSAWLQSHIESPLPKGQRPLFTVVSRANGGEA